MGICQGGQLLRRGFKDKKSSKEVHEGICDEHQGGSKIFKQLTSLSYYWPIVEADASSLDTPFYTP